MASKKVSAPVRKAGVAKDKKVKMGESKRHFEGYGPWKPVGNPGAGVSQRKTVSDAIRRGKGK